MHNAGWIRKWGAVTLFFFCWFLIAGNYGFAAEEDALLNARRSYQQGDYEAAIKILTQFIEDLKAIVAQKKNVAEAFYLLAKVYFTVGEDERANQNIRKVFETYPPFEKNENDIEFRDRVEKIRQEMGRTAVVPPQVIRTETEAETPAVTEQQVIETPVKKTKKKFPWLLVIGGAVAIAAVVFLLMGSKKEESKITGVTVRIDLTFAGTNLQCRHTIRINGGEKLSEVFQFNVPSSSDYNDAKKINRTITVTLPPGTFTIEHEMSPDYTTYFTGSAWIWATRYNLSITNFDHTGDFPGNPTLSEDEFDISVAPWHSDPTHEWYRIESKTVTIVAPTPPSQRASKGSKRSLLPKEPRKTGNRR